MRKLGLLIAVVTVLGVGCGHSMTNQVGLMSFAQLEPRHCRLCARYYFSHAVA